MIDPNERPSLANAYVAEASRPERVRILLVEDSEYDIEVLRKRLQEFHVSVIVATGKEDAIRLAQSRPFDIAMVDMWLPWAGNGIAVMRALREKSRYLPICAYSAQLTPEDIARTCEAVGVVTFAVKRLVMEDRYIYDLFVQFGLARRAGIIE